MSVCGSQFRLRRVAHRAGVRDIVSAELIRACSESLAAEKGEERLHRFVEIMALSHRDVEALPGDRHDLESGGFRDRAGGDAAVGAVRTDRLCNVRSGRTWRRNRCEILQGKLRSVQQ